MANNAKNAHAQDPDVERAYQVLLAQKCWDCGGPGARHVLYAKNGPAVSGVEYMNDKGLLDAGFENVGFIHSRSDNGGACYEKFMANKPKGIQMQLVVRESVALQNWVAAKERAKKKKAVIADRWSALQKVVSKPASAPVDEVDETESVEAISTPVDDNVVETKPVEAAPAPVDKVVPDETPATPAQVASSQFGSLMGFVKKVVEG